MEEDSLQVYKHLFENLLGINHQAENMQAEEGRGVKETAMVKCSY